MQKSTDPQFSLLARISQSLKLSYMEDELIWEDSPFQWLKTRPSRQRGTIAEIFVSEWCAANGLNVGLSPDSDADRLIDGVRSEIKSSTLWSGGFYKFQQIRDQNYEIVICLGMSPFEAHCWVLPKKIILEGWGVYEGLKSQHGGKVGTDTAWLEVYPDSVQDWLREYGGSLSEGLAVLRSLVT